MKVGGIIALIFGVINLIVGIGGLSTQYADQATGKIGFGIGAIVLGIYLLNRANQKKEEQKEKDKWNSGN
ncbi:MAG: hypothetical protein GW839_14175 [Flavobacteriales bacterium]|nr:hypothetical protein [Flavobacteriales bacterium]NCP61430.1 hypothetical protein [Flavobacteriales bacterium]NCP90832.1 hypothetical protein [Flavobacteriales bacterium]NCQ15957.1 hypothetical protein [Flavobacteriales bacterium]PIV50512.1 MAG: hypothetical protein COS19_03980 [Flavobacteriaceae bacterium CG02_land_8_20_14_3_00_34_13]